MPYCAIITCKNKSQIANVSKGGISYHRFPQEPDVKDQWIKATGRKQWFPTKTSTVCSAHFVDTDFVPKPSGHKYLNPQTIPTVDIWISNKGASTSSEAVADSLCDLTNQLLTPRKRKLQTIIDNKEKILMKQKLQIKRLQTQNRRYRKKIQKIEDLLKAIEEKSFMRGEDLTVLKNSNIQVQELMSRHIKNIEAGHNVKQKYSPGLRTFALTLHFYSPKAYNFVRKTFHTCLPHPRTLKKWYESIDGSPGFTKESFVALKLKAETTEHKIYANLVLDEMAIRQRIEWDGKRFHGYVEFGSEISNDFLAEAKEALVFLVTSVNGKWKVPVGYFLIDGLSGTQRANLTLQCLQLISETSVKIISITCDGCSANVNMLKELGCDLEKSEMIFVHPETKEQVAAILDPAHMLKLLRNAFEAYKIFVDKNGNQIKWSYLEELHKLQENENFHLANKLRKIHIYFQNQKMRVKLASQLFSNSVADAISFCDNDLKLPQFRGSKATVKFLRTVNDLFDIFNSRNVQEFGFKKPLNEGNKEKFYLFIQDAVNYLKTLKVDDMLVINSPRKLGFLGFIGCCQALMFFYDTLIQEKLLVYLPFYKLSQDHLELLFCFIRAHFGCNNNPTSRQFKSIYKKILTHIQIRDVGNGNCTELEKISILNYSSSSIERINRTTGRDLADDADDEINDEVEDELAQLMSDTIQMSEFGNQIVSYIAGYVVHIILRKIKCDTCISALLAEEKSKSLHNFILAKDKGGLLYPSRDVIEICKRTEQIIKTYVIVKQENIAKMKIMNKVLQYFVHTNVFSSISFHQDFPTASHVTDLIKAVMEKYINLRLHFVTKNFNSQLSKRQLLNKYILFQGQ